jgi:hypothetical protein
MLRKFSICFQWVETGKNHSTQHGGDTWPMMKRRLPIGASIA